MQPSVNKEELAKLKVADLRAKAAELGVDAAGLKKAELVDAVYEASVKAEGFIEVSGILDILADGYGFLRTQGYLPSENDCYVGLSTIRRNGLRKGDLVCGQTRPARENEKYAAIQKVISRQRHARRGARRARQVRRPHARLSRRVPEDGARQEAPSPPASSTWWRPSARASAA